MSAVSLTDFEENLKKLCSLYTNNESGYEIHLPENNFKSFEILLLQHGLQFSVRSSDIYDEKTSRLLWSSPLVPFFGNPFMIEKVSSCHCINGPKYYEERKKRVKPLLDHQKERKTRFRLKPSKKMDCSATMRIVLIKKYLNFSITGKKNLKDEKYEIMKRLKKQLDTNINADSVATEKIYRISFSPVTAHSHPVLTNLMNQQLHSDLKDEIKKLVNSGITNIQTIQNMLRDFVKNTLGSVTNSSTAFYPKKKTIRNHVAEPGETNGETTDLEVAHPSDSLYSASAMLMHESHNDLGGIASYAVVSTSESSGSAEKLVSISEIRQLAKTAYDRTFLLRGKSVGEDCKRKLIAFIDSMDPFVESLPVSELPPSKKRKV